MTFELIGMVGWQWLPDKSNRLCRLVYEVFYPEKRYDDFEEVKKVLEKYGETVLSKMLKNAPG